MSVIQSTVTHYTADSDYADILDKIVYSHQGQVVRTLKGEKADKGAINKAVAELLELKKLLAAAQGVDITSQINKGKKGKRKTK